MLVILDILDTQSNIHLMFKIANDLRGDLNTGIFFPSADTIAFTEGGSEAMRINSDGNLALVKNIGLGGATPTTSGTGITFPASASASTNGNTLDDYEEGTWTPRYSAASGGELGGTQIDSNNNYTKIGRLVNISFTMYINSINLSGKSGVVTITGLPFTSNGNFFAGVINSPSGAAFNSFINIPLRGLIDSTNIVLYKGISSGVEQQLITTDFNTAGGNGNYILMSAFYIT